MYNSILVRVRYSDGSTDKVCNGDRPKLLFDTDGVTPVALTSAAGEHPWTSSVPGLDSELGLLSCRATLDRVAEDTDVIIVDVMGQLLYWYGASSVAFVGGSLVPHGGHNFLEAALCGCAIVTGPWVFNFEAQAEQFQRAEALTLVADEPALSAAFEMLLVDPVIRQQQIDRAQQLVEESRGVLDKLLVGLSPWLPDRAGAPK